MPASKAQQKAVAKYMKENYDEIKIRFPKGEKDSIKAYAASRGESMNAFIYRAIQETMEREKGPITDEAMDDAFCKQLLAQYEADPEKNQAFSLEDCKKEWGLA